MTKLRVLDLFSGIGGFSLGLERTGGFETVAFCEIEDYPRRVLAKHWPHVPCYDDVRTLTAARLAADGIAVDVICGGFPCQDVSFAGKRAGLEGARSGLWGEYARLIGELRPRYVLVENVPGLLSLGMGTVLGDLAALGYDATWDCIPAAAVGAPHQRDRVWIVAHSGGEQHKGDCAEKRWKAASELHVANANGKRVREQSVSECRRDGSAVAEYDCKDVAYADNTGLEGRNSGELRQRADECTARTSSAPDGSDASRFGRIEGRPDTGGSGERDGPNQWSGPSDGCWWLFEPNVGRVANGVPARMDRLKGLGNAVVPQIPEMIGRAILEAEGLTP